MIKYLFKFNKNYVLILFVFLLGCAHKFPVDNQEVKDIKVFIQNLCPLNEKVDTSQDIILATIYYKINEVNLSKEDQIILDQVIKLFNCCNKKLLILSHSSNEEFNANPVAAAKLSYFRAYNVYNYLNNNIFNNYLYMDFCSNLRNKFIENTPNAVLGNQRVEIIMLGNNTSSGIVNCFGNNNEIN